MLFRSAYINGEKTNIPDNVVPNFTSRPIVSLINLTGTIVFVSPPTFEEVGATVNNINDTQTIEVSSDEYDVVMRINDNVAYINGESGGLIS